MCVLIFFKAQALIASDEEITEKTKLKKMLQTKAELRKKGGGFWWRRQLVLNQITTRTS